MGPFEKLSSLALETRKAWMSFVDEAGVKALPQVTIARCARSGFQNLMLCSGLGGMRPNTVVLPMLGSRHPFEDLGLHDDDGESEEKKLSSSPSSTTNSHSHSHSSSLLSLKRRYTELMRSVKAWPALPSPRSSPRNGTKKMSSLLPAGDSDGNVDSKVEVEPKSPGGAQANENSGIRSNDNKNNRSHQASPGDYVMTVRDALRMHMNVVLACNFEDLSVDLIGLDKLRRRVRAARELAAHEAAEAIDASGREGTIAPVGID